MRPQEARLALAVRLELVEGFLACLVTAAATGSCADIYVRSELVEGFMPGLVTAAAKRALCQRANGSLAPSG